MKIEIWWIGKTFQNFTAAGYSDYLKRLQKLGSVSIIEIPDVKGQQNPVVIKSAEAEKILKKLKDDDYIVLLDEKGRTFTSLEFANYLKKKEDHSTRRLIFLIGGAYGFDDSVYKRANDQLSLSKMTFSHQLIRLIFMEQLYRAFTIMRGIPYHNE